MVGAMLVSMTGFGRGDAEADGLSVSVEIRAVNGRHGDVLVRLPRSLAELEPRVKEVVLTTISRGRVEVSVFLKGGKIDHGMPILNVDVLHAYREVIEQLKARMGLSAEVDPLKMALLPNVFDFAPASPDVEAVWAVVEPACKAALAECQHHRVEEGKRLRLEFLHRVEILESLIARAEDRAPARVGAIRQKIEEKLKEVLAPEAVDKNRLLMEVALLAERSDMTEEFVRLRSHNAQFLDTLEREEAVGRRLNFLLQEMLREANTIGSKAGDAEIAHLVVEMKEEVEKLREQAQNVE
jgi:uncharacterized protein (TIGR00255 family)